MHSSKHKLHSGGASLLGHRSHFNHQNQRQEGGTMRKVRSFDSVRLNGLEFKGGWKQPSASTRARRKLIQDGKASRFSSLSAGQRALPSTPESTVLHDRVPYNKSFTNLNEMDINTSPLSSHHGLSRPSSVSSLSGLDMPEPDEGMSGPIITLMDVLKGGNVRSGALLNLIILTLLLFATISDVAFKSSTETSYYSHNEELSREVLYPPYSSRIDPNEASNKPSKSKNQQKKGLLGSAMMQSVTEALSPILPFAGGVDLRRDENWKSWNSWLSLWAGSMDIRTDANKSGLDQLASVPRGGGQNKKNHLMNNAGRKKKDFATKTTLSTPEPFLSTSDISKMTLEEIAVVFKYAISSGTEDMNVSTFLKQRFSKYVDKTRLDRAINAIANATTKSRGDGVITALTSHSEKREKSKPLSEINGFGDIDALEFCAAMRILAEWRVLRQTPPGFKGYAVGMNLGHKDVVQNIVKIESVVHQWIETQSEAEAFKRGQKDCNNEESCIAESLRSPTLRDLLRYEVDGNVHPNSKLPRLKDQTAAMGLLWVRRQLQYQTAIFSNIISVPDVYPTIIDAVGAAYSEVYGHLHGWTVQKIFNYSFQSAPDADLIFRHMNPYKLEQVTTAAKNGKFTSKAGTEDTEEAIDLPGEERIPISEERIVLEVEHHHGDNHLMNFFSHIGSEWDKLGKHVGEEIDKLGHQIGGEWDKVICNFSKIFDEHSKECKVNDFVSTRGGASSSSSGRNRKQEVQISDDELDAHIAREMAADARQHILAYLNIAVPLLEDLAGLFEEMNMDDPTKV